eukprot:8665065-Pyramimonas_sp.AAC.1
MHPTSFGLPDIQQNAPTKTASSSNGRQPAEWSAEKIPLPVASTAPFVDLCVTCWEPTAMCQCDGQPCAIDPSSSQATRSRLAGMESTL